VRDAGLIACAHAVEHYEMARYGALIAWANTLGNAAVVALLQANLDQEKRADTLLTKIAGPVNKMAVAA
jgi:ferritin-like metal-binding protein YciE